MEAKTAQVALPHPGRTIGAYIGVEHGAFSCTEFNNALVLESFPIHMHEL
jgi:hypothetical protein